MKILVDADACPVKDIIIKTGEERKIPVKLIMDTSHPWQYNGSYEDVEIITVDKARDGVDIALINLTNKNDIVVTQDYGVAAMALGKGAMVLNQNGLIFSSENIDRLLFERHLGQKIRRAGGRTKSIRKRSKEDDERFLKALLLVIDSISAAENER
ncbi:MAG: YaiI/YqxD family protein [Clostridiaceae bacterium]|nr:YaiI/YqxD family protein [Clostridiaceae bacterium]